MTEQRRRCRLVSLSWMRHHHRTFPTVRKPGMRRTGQSARNTCELESSHASGKGVFCSDRNGGMSSIHNKKYKLHSQQSHIHMLWSKIGKNGPQCCTRQAPSPPNNTHAIAESISHVVSSQPMLPLFIIKATRQSSTLDNFRDFI